MKFTGPILKQGTWLYDGEVICDLRIVRHDWYYASGDYEDPPEVREDRQVEFYYLEFAPPLKRGEFQGGGCYESIAEALRDSARLTNGTVKWND